MFFFSCCTGHIDIIQWLISHNCTTQKDDLGGTPLHDAAEHGQLQVSV